MSPSFWNALTWGGALVSLLGLGGIVLSILRVQAARKAGLDDAALRARLQQLVGLNIAALFVSVLGLMLVVVGIMLG